MKMFKPTIITIFVISIYSLTLEAKTVQQVLDAAGCDTGAVGGLAKQLVTTLNRSSPGIMSNLTVVPHIKLSSSAAAVPFIQTAALIRIKKAIAARKTVTLPINSALRTLPQQVLIYKWYQKGKCGITLAAKPGTSPHESGLAIDTSLYSEWKKALVDAGCSWQGLSDKVHFTCAGTKLGKKSVSAFQKLWNCNNPKDKIAEDGAYGPATESRVLKSPATGFAKTC